MPARLPISVPLVPPVSLDRLGLQIEALHDGAHGWGLGTLADLLEVALTEARHQAEQGRRDAGARDADPGDLWRPVP